MADVNDRGQLIIVMGLILAVAFVILALLLNTVIFTENLASRGTDLGGRDAVEFQRTVIDGVGGLVDEENDNEHGTHQAAEDNVTEGIEEIDTVLAERNAETGVVADIDESAITYHDGDLIRQTDASRNFTDLTGLLADWTMVFNVSETRRFAMTVDRSDLAVANESNATTALHVRLEANLTTDHWQAFVYENATTGNISLAVNRTGTGVTEVCSVNQATATVNLTAGTLAGESCDGLDWADGLSGGYDITYRNGDEVSGTYNLTVNTSPTVATVNPLTVNDGTVTTDSPYHVPAVYSLTVPIYYETADVRYEASIRIARGEPA